MPKGLYIAAVNYVRTAGPGVYELVPDSSYAKVEFSAPLPLDALDSPNFVFASGRPLGITYLYAIKTQNVASGCVEVHVIDRHDLYRTFIRQKPSAIDVTDGQNFDFLGGEFGDLICVKRRDRSEEHTSELKSRL